MDDPLAVALKFGFLAVLYLFLLWVSRSALRDLVRGAGGGAAVDPEPVILARHIQVEQDQVRGRYPSVLFPASQESHRLHAVQDVMEVVVDLALLERLDREPGVSGVVFYQENLYRFAVIVHDVRYLPPTTAE